MDSKKAWVALIPALMIAACERTQTEAEESGPSPTANASNGASEEGFASAPDGPSANGVDDGNANLTPPVLTAEAERGVEGARNVLLSFARALEEREFGQAWSLLSSADKRKWSKAEFAAILSDLDKITVAVPTGTMEGAAGSSYYSAPIAITGSAKDGRPVRIEGKAVLRRVNDVEGATPEQLRWHFETLTLDWTH